MNPTKDDHWVRIDGAVVRVIGETGPVEATWRLLIDDREADVRTATGTFSLHGALPAGDPVEARVTQGNFGRTEVTLLRGDEEMSSWKGFVL